MTLVHRFAGNPLDRADAERRDDGWLSAAENDPASRFLPFYNLDVLLAGGGSLGWTPGSTVRWLEVEAPPVFLGVAGDIPHFALDVSELKQPARDLGLENGWRFQDCRLAAMAMRLDETGIVAQARAQLGWHRSHRFCSRCGAQTEQRKGGHVRICQQCDAEHFPRTDPVVIMAIHDDRRCLLGQPKGPLVRMGMYSALAGFIDQGESIEEAVRREVREEAGIEVGEVRYHSSQPWPFPSSLMIGCLGRATSTEIRIDPAEMADVRWFARDEIVAALGDENPGLKVPGSLAIAHHLIRSWALTDPVANRGQGN